jgi:PAS domain S-box-containing protein
MNLSASTNLFHALADHLNLPVFVSTAHSNEQPSQVVFANQALLSLVEKDQTTVKLHDLIGIQAESTITQKVQSLLTKEENSEIDLFISTSSGRKFWVGFLLKPMRINEQLYFLWQQNVKSNSGNAIPLYSFMDGDFTLELNDSPQIVFAFNTKWRLIYTNEKCCQMTGHTSEKLLDSGFSILLQGNDIQQAEESFQKTLTGQHQEIRLAIHTQFGSIQHWQIDGYPFYQDGKVAGTVCFANDITNEIVEQQTNEIVNQLLTKFQASANLKEGLAAMLAALCEETNLAAGECWLPDYMHNKERLMAAYYPDNTHYQKFRDFSSTLELTFIKEHPRNGKDEPIRVINLFLDPDFSRKKVCEELGLTVGFAIPVEFADQQIATLMFFSELQMAEELKVIRLFRNLALRLGSYIESKRIALESRQIFQLVPDLLCILDRSGKFYRVNQRFSEILGKPAEDLVGTSFFDWVDEGYVEISLTAFQNLQTKEVSRFENVVVDLNGKKFWLEWSLSLNTQDGIVYAAGKDLTLRILYDEELRSQNEKFRLLRQATNDAIYDWDIKQDIIDWGDSFSRLFGHIEAPGSSSIHNWEDFIHPVDKERVMNNLQAGMLNKGRYWIDEYQYLCADGTYKYILDRGIFLYDDKGNALRMIGTMQDITALKQSEATLIQLNDALQHRAHQLLGFNKELEQFAYIVSHDLQEPLRMISSFMQLLLNSKEISMTERTEQYVGFAIDGANRMKRLIQDLLTYSRVGTTEEDFVDLSMKEIMHDTLLVYQQMIRERDAKVHVNELPNIRGIRSLLQQIIDNLLSNAIKYNDKSRPEIYIDYEESITHHIFSVKDNGIGIDSRQHDLIYLPFKRLHNKNEFSGTGIGLAVCKKIVEKHQGQIWVESSLGEGSTFYFSIHK